MQLHDLAIELRVGSHVVDLSMGNHPQNIYDATYYVLDEWKRNQQNSNEAFKNMCEALSNIKENAIIYEVLSGDTHEQRNIKLQNLFFGEILKNCWHFCIRSKFLITSYEW